MKKSFRIVLAVLAIVSISAACSKEIDISNPIDDNARETLSTEGKITIKATLPDALTRVSFTQDTNEGGNPILKLAWEENDKLLVADHADPTNTEKQAIFDLDASCVGSTEGVFTGTPATEGPYDVSVVHGNNVTTTQTQPADGDASGLEYVASAVDVSDLSAIEFQSVSSVLALQAKLPNGIASTVNAVTFKSNAAIFSSGNTLTVSLTTAGVQSGDDILDIFATLAPGDVEIPVGTVLIVEFGTTAPKYITRYHKFTAAAAFKSGKYNSLKLKCVNLTSTASDCVLDGNGTDGHAYEIGDKYQLMAVQDLASTTSKTYFKMIADVDMAGMTDYVPINENVTDFAQVVDFNGNQKTVSNLGKHLFYVLKGSVYDLTLAKSNISTRGILAEYIQGVNNVITNVTVLNGVVKSSADNVGGLIGCINKGAGSNAEAIIQQCTVTGTTVEGKGVVGGVIGFADAKVSVSDCKFMGNNVTASARYVGGFVGSTGNYESTFQNCQVENATIQSTVSNNDFRAGGFVGQLQTKVQLKGCTVGTSDKKITLSLSDPTAGKVYNAGGFVGVCYGTITKKDDVRSKTFVKITASNTTTTANVNIGGFVGYVDGGRIEYSDAEVEMSGLNGQRIGGFAGFVTNKPSTIDHCTVDGTVTGNHYTGGFVGYIDAKTPVITNNTVNGTVSGNSTVGGLVGVYGKTSNNAVVAPDESDGYHGTFTGNTSSATVSGASNVGGLMGYCWAPATFTKNAVSADITTTGGGIGGIIGNIETSITVTGSSYEGTISASGDKVGGIIGNVNQATPTLNVNNCWSDGTISVSRTKQRIGGIIGNMNVGGSITNCYSNVTVGVGRVLGGIVGYACAGSGGNWNTSNETGITVSGCIAWNPSVAWDPGTETNTNYGSSGAIVGFTSVKNVLSNCYRRSDMTYQNSNQQANCQTTMVDQPNCNGTNWTKGTTIGTDGTNNCPYYGVTAASGATVSSIAQTLSWDSTIWDFSGPLPLLK